MVMSYDSMLQEQEQALTAPVAAPALPDLQAAIEQVARDSQVAPDKYLEESTVPHGGE
jgi:hypothetical protein